MSVEMMSPGDPLLGSGPRRSQWALLLGVGGLAGVAAALAVAQAAGVDRLPIGIWGGLAPAALALALGWTLCSLRTSPDDGRGVFLLAFAARLALALVLAYIYQAQDEQILHHLSSVASHRGVHFWTKGTDTQEGYAATIALVFDAFGVNFLVAKLPNVLMGSLLPFLLYDIAGAVGGEERYARRALLLGAFAPPLLFFSALNLKELPSAFLLSLTLWLLLVPKWNRTVRTAMGMLGVIAVYSLRGGWAVYPLLAVILFQLRGKQGLSLKRLASPKAVLTLGLTAFVIVVPLHSLLQGAIEHIQYRLFIGAYASFGSLQQAGSSITGSMLDLQHIWSPRNIAIQLARAPFSPSPLEFFFSPAVSSFIDSANALTQYLLFPLALVAVVHHRGRVMMLAGVELALLITNGMSLMLGLTIQRQGIPHFAILYLLAALGAPHWREHRWIVGAWTLATLAFSAVLVYYRV